MNLILTVHIRWFLSIFSVLAVIALRPVPAVNAQYDLRASLKSGPSLERIPPVDFSGNEAEPARGRFLVATRRLQGSFFSRTVIFLFNHGEQGSTGLIINRPSSIKLSTVFPDEKIFQQTDDTVYAGGPVGLDSLFVLFLSYSKPPDSEHVIDNLYMTSKLETLKHVYDHSDSNDNIRILAGYAGWGPGQLMNEIKTGSWHVMTGDTELIFDKYPESLWDRFIQRKLKQWVRVFINQSPASIQ
jgi:putative transcriptional regulator